MQEQDIPIDIHANKLLDWLLSRKVCSKDWQKTVLIIREKINNAIQDMPIHKGITILVSGSYINYFHCRKIIEILKETESSSKNIFGSYGSQRMKDWLEIVRLYEKDNVYLAEAAQMLIRNVNFEIPGLKKDILHSETLINECVKKEELRLKSMNMATKEFETLCKSLGIQGKNIKQELTARTGELPEIYASVAKSAKTLEKSVQFYTEFTKFVLGKEHQGGCVPLLHYIIEKGNTSIYEWTTGKVPDPKLNNMNIVKSEDIVIEDDTDKINFDEIDYDAGITVVNDAGEIDFGTDDNAIDFGTDENIIDFSIETVGESCSEEQYTSLLDSSKTRDIFIDELRELEAFLRIRIYEMSNTNDMQTLSQMPDAPTTLQLQTVETVRQMTDSVQKVIQKITDPITHHLHNIKYSQRYVDNLSSKLQQKLNLVAKKEAMKSVLADKQTEMVAHIKSLQPKLKLITEKTKVLQEEIEQEISKKYKNRPVSIMGGVSSY